MGRRGPAPTPASVLRLTGSKRHLSKDREDAEPTVDGKVPECPEDFGEAQRREWGFITKQLCRLGVMDTIDTHALYRYCVAYKRWRACESFIDENGIKYRTYDEGGSEKGWAAYPEVAESGRLANILTKLEIELCMTPSARARIGKLAEVRGKEKSLGDSFYKCG